MKSKYIAVGDIFMRFNVFIFLQDIFHVNKVGSIIEETVAIEEKDDITVWEVHYILLCFHIHPIINYTFFFCLPQCVDDPMKTMLIILAK